MIKKGGASNLNNLENEFIKIGAEDHKTISKIKIPYKKPTILYYSGDRSSYSDILEPVEEEEKISDNVDAVKLVKIKSKEEDDLDSNRLDKLIIHDK